MTTCVSCSQPLEVEIEVSDDEDVEMAGSSSAAESNKKTFPDDVYLNCGCHFHWQCLLDAFSVIECPHCNHDLTSTSEDGVQQLLCNLTNEGGVQESLDILPLLTEESYLKAYPEERKARAFLEFCREGDLQAIIDMIRQDPNDEDNEQQGGNYVDILRYQDPIGDMQSGLHAAVAGGSREVAWLLLLLASELDLLEFPPQVFQEAEALGIMRGDLIGKVDIRTLRDAQDRTADDLAREIDGELPGVWHGWPGTGRLSVEGS